MTRSVVPARPRPAPPARPPVVHDENVIRLPGMELLGFFDEPYRVSVDRPSPPPRFVAEAPLADHAVTEPATPGRRQNGRSLVENLWESTRFDDSILDWRPGVVARRKLGGRQMSTATMVATLVATAVLSALLWFSVQRPAQQAEAAETALRRDATSALATISELRVLAVSLGTDELSDLDSSTSVILGAESSARALFSSAGAVAETLETGGLRETAVSASGDVLAAVGEVNRLLAYRGAAERALVAPALTTDPGSVDLTDAVGAVSEWRAGVQEAIGGLPADALGAHFRLVADWEAGLQAWQEGYLDALRENDGGAAEEMLAAVTAEVSSLRRSLIDQLEVEAARLDADLAAAEALLAGLVAG